MDVTWATRSLHWIWSVYWLSNTRTPPGNSYPCSETRWNGDCTVASEAICDQRIYIARFSRNELSWQYCCRLCNDADLPNPCEYHEVEKRKEEPQRVSDPTELAKCWWWILIQLYRNDLFSQGEIGKHIHRLIAPKPTHHWRWMNNPIHTEISRH